MLLEKFLGYQELSFLKFNEASYYFFKLSLATLGNSAIMPVPIVP